MKKIIRNKVYDTERAVLMCGYMSNLTTATLYRKRTGEYFLHTVDRLDESIRPVTYDEARAFSLKYMEKDKFSKTFEDASDEYTNLHFLIPPDKGLKMKRVAEERGISLRTLLVEMINNL